MSETINVYAVSVDRLRQILGSRNQALIDDILALQADFLSMVDSDDEAEMTCAHAVAHLINGEMPDDASRHLNYLYGFAFEAICWQVGEELPNICGIAGGASNWIETVDSILERKGVPVRLFALLYHGSPVPIPEPDDYPFIGRWMPDEVAAASASFPAVDLGDIDREMAETVQQVRGWVETAAATPGTCVVGFLS